MFVSAATLTFDKEQKHQLESFYRLGEMFPLVFSLFIGCVRKNVMRQWNQLNSP
jgi:hypothetical protein